jgi:hypothetical protein
VKVQLIGRNIEEGKGNFDGSFDKFVLLGMMKV